MVHYVCVCVQECLEKCGESLQEIVNYHTVRHTHTLHYTTHTSTPALATGEGSRCRVVLTRPGPPNVLMCFRRPLHPGSRLVQYTDAQSKCDLSL